MRLRPNKLALMTVCLLFLALAALGFSPAAALAGQVTGSITPVQYRGEAGGGSLEIRIRSDEGAQYPPGDLVLSDPAARMTGSDTRDNATYHEIPGATYTAEDISPRQQAFALYVDGAVSGTYSLRVIGVDYGKYYLSMKGYDRSGTHADISFTALLEPGQVHHYLINYSNIGGASIRARRTRITE